MARIELTRRVVKEAVCPCDKVKIDLFDLQSGFMLEVRRSGGKTYYQRYTDQRGKTRQQKIGPADLVSLTEAKRKGRQVAAQAILGEDPFGRRQELRAIPTLAELVRDRYLPYAKNTKLSWRTDETMLRKHVLPALGRTYVDQLRSDNITALVGQMQGAGYASGTTNRAVIVLRHLFNLSKTWRIPGVQENPTAGIKLAPDVSRERFLSREELDKLRASLDVDENKQAANAIRLLIATGARRNEVTQARWEDVDYDNSVLIVPRSKSGRPRRVALNTAARLLLQSMERVADNPWIFPSPTTGRPSPSLYFPWRRIRARAGLQDVRLHDLRHSFASFLANGDVSLYKIQELLGHSASRYTQRYTHLTTASVLDAAEMMSDILMGKS